MMIYLQVIWIKPGGVLKLMTQLISVGWVQFEFGVQQYSNLAYRNLSSAIRAE